MFGAECQAEVITEQSTTTCWLYKPVALDQDLNPSNQVLVQSVQHCDQAKIFFTLLKNTC